MSIITVTVAEGMRHPLTDISFTVNHKSDAGTLVNATTIAMKWRVNQEQVETSTLTNTGTGVYTATARPTKGGTLAYQITATYDNEQTTKESKVRIDHGWFEDQNRTTDYQ